MHWDILERGEQDPERRRVRVLEMFIEMNVKILFNLCVCKVERFDSDSVITVT